MNFGELKAIENLTDETPVAILLSDGTLDYAVGAWLDENPGEDGKTLVLTGN